MAIIRGRAFLMPYENVGSWHLEEAPLALTNVRFEGNKGHRRRDAMTHSGHL